ncbi:MAG: hypothetical protein OEZ02_14030 [Anaerolineae bacterium]|nr:hypothetical protein [Anaerolineae bacterium]
MRTRFKLLFFYIPIMVTALACGNFGNVVENAVDDAKERAKDAVEQAVKDAIAQALDEVGLPVPEEIDTIEISSGAVSFQTDTSVDNLVLFFRASALAQSLTERQALTSISATSATLVFDGHESGKAIVVQIVMVASSTTNVTIRQEDI